MRNISFSLTTPQFLDGTKDVTRRMGWLFLKEGEKLRAVEKAMGLRKGQRQNVLGHIRVISVRRESLSRMYKEVEYGKLEAAREGFPNMDGATFVDFFLNGHAGCTPGSLVTRIEFKRI